MNNFHRNTNSDKGDTSVRRNEKAPSVGSTPSRGSLLRSASPPAAGTGAPSRSARRLSLLVLTTIAAALLAATTASAAPPTLTIDPVASQTCPNQSFRIGRASGLPDCRAWEMVSLPDKNGGDVMAQQSRTRAARSGDAISFVSLTAFGDTAGTGITAEYLSRRDAVPGTNGWSTHSILPKLQPLSLDAAVSQLDSFYDWEFSDDLNNGVLRTYTNLDGDPNVENVGNLYLRSDLLVPGGGSYSLLTKCPACGSPLEQTQSPAIADATPDFGHILFEAQQPLTADASPAFNARQLYEFDHGTLRLAGILPDAEGGGPAPASIAATGAIGRTYTLRTISDDGSRINFTVPVNGNGNPGLTRGELYQRIDHSSTIHLNASERTDCAGDPSCGGNGTPDPAPDPNGPFPAWFGTASVDGLRVFFMTPEQLTDDDNNGEPDLYRYDTSIPANDPHNLTRISADSEPSDGSAAEVTGVIGASENGDYLYFGARGQLVEGAPTPFGSGGVFVWHDGELAYVGGLVGGSNEESESHLTMLNGNAELNARVAPNGRYLLFTSRNGQLLTGYDQESQCIDSTACSELYLYDADEEETICASCRPSGAPATVDASFRLGTGFGGSHSTTHLNHPLSADGRHVFFTSAEALVPEDTNGKDDAYEFDTQTAEPHLLSSGNSSDASYFLDASADGADAFFATREQLLGWDSDQAYDLYDARVGGGLPEPAPLASICRADACRALASSPPSPHSVSSSTPTGSGNLKAERRKHKHHKHHHRHHKHHSRGTTRNGQGGSR